MENELEVLIDQAQEQEGECQKSQDALAESLGALEAVGEYFTADDPHVLPERQKRLVELVRGHNKHRKTKVEAAIDYNVAVEGFSDFLTTVSKKSLISTVESVQFVLGTTASSLGKYVELSKPLLKRLRQLRVMVEKHQGEHPVNDVFNLGAHRRFLQVNNTEIVDFEGFKTTFLKQVEVTNYTYIHGIGYSNFIADRIIKDMDKLQASDGSDLREDLRKSIVFHWTNVWRDGFKTDKAGIVPKEFVAANPDTNNFPVCPLFDARYLVATCPRKSSDLSRIGGYRAALAFDKASLVKPKGELQLSIDDDFLPVIDAAISLLNDMQYYAELSKKCSKLSKDFKQAAKTVIANLENNMDKNSMGAAVEYIRMVATGSNILTAPHIDVAWMVIRSSLVVAAIAETVACKNEKDRAISKKFFTSQSKGFSSSLESYTDVAVSLVKVAATIPDKK